MAVDISAYRASESEQARITDLLALMPDTGECALDISARDGYLAKKLAERFDSVIALDLEQPDIEKLSKN
ncbi:MAG: hypothetical protein IPL59_12515 [Candidatus Competibacteraceae bacterium]|nr:hypothetical protein [Candidatus Competibacteraceae bacterium]